MTYRPEIDGLRAIAILLVVLFHAEIPYLTGGFIGVDVFFVLSGFLITSIIYNETIEGRFSIAGFYERRIRRIIPALAVVMAATLIAAWLLFMPGEMMGYGRSLAATAGYVSNILFYREAGYFDSSAMGKPLLHTWSLSVEEQFYIFFPLYVIVVLRYARKYFAALTVAGLLVSLGISEALLHVDKQPASFYNLPTRAWELLIGSLLAIGVIKQTFTKRANNIISAIGVAFILFGAFWLNSSSPFPGLNALWPTLGAAMVLFGTANQLQGNFVRSALSSRGLVFIGKISYSLYLWHWPVLVFSLYYLMDNDDMWVRVALVIASVILSIASYYFVEQPIRKDRKISRKSIFGATALISVFFIVSGIAIYVSKGMPSRFGDDIQTLTSTTKGIIEGSGTATAEGKQILIGLSNPSSKITYLVWGDSHANSLAPAMDALGKEQKTSGYVYKKAGCFPSNAESAPSKADCKETGRNVYEAILNTPTIKTVVLVSRWSAYPRWWAKGDSDEQENDGFAIFEKEMDNLVGDLRKLGKNVVIVTEPPLLQRVDVSSVLARNIHFSRNVDVSASYADYLEEGARLRSIIEGISAKHSASLVRLDQALCRNGHCDFVHDGRSLYYDSDHLSTYGADHLVPYLNKQIRLNP